MLKEDAMQPVHFLCRALFALPALTFILALAATASAEVGDEVSPGEMISFSQAEGGEEACWRFSLGVEETVSCDGLNWRMWYLPYHPTEYDPVENTVRAVYSNAYWPDPFGNLFAAAKYAATSVYNDFSIAESENGENFVDAQISIAYDVWGGMIGVFSYDKEMSLGLSIEDITDDPDSPVAVGALELFKKGSSGEQGLTDLNVGATQVDLRDETARLMLKLRRGRTYRILFTSQAFSVTPGVASGEVSVHGHWTQLSVGIDQDVPQLLAEHDNEIKSELAAHDLNIDGDLATHQANISSQLATHDTDLKSQLATHDADIKALLGNIQATVDENQRLIKVFMSRQLDVMRLLITPEGRREINEDVLTCTGDDCPTYPDLPLCPNGSLKWNCRP